MRFTGVSILLKVSFKNNHIFVFTQIKIKEHICSMEPNPLEIIRKQIIHIKCSGYPKNSHKKFLEDCFIDLSI